MKIPQDEHHPQKVSNDNISSKKKNIILFVGLNGKEICEELLSYGYTGLSLSSYLLAEQRGAYLRELVDLGMVEKRSRLSGDWMACWMEKAA